MTLRLLVTYYGVRLTRWEDIEVAVDRHVARVFVRTGLVRPGEARTRYASAKVHAEVQAAARRLRPSFPGALDEPAYFIGKTWCTDGRPRCRDGSGSCPLLRACPRRRLALEVD